MARSIAAADYVIVGAGSAGCVAANHLSAAPTVRVALVEAGGPDRSPWIHVPVGYFRTMGHPRLDWRYRTEPDPGLGGRALNWPRGKVLGGSSSLNGLLYVRGQHQDYDRWAQMGNPGWSWEQVGPVFEALETWQDGAGEGRGTSGPLQVSAPRLTREICELWLRAAQARGHPLNPDYNGAVQDGVAHFQLTASRGRRSSAATAFLRPVRGRPNLEVVTEAQAMRVLVEEGRATGVDLRRPDGSRQVLRAAREVILCAGSIGSPQLLMLSGVGDGDHLARHGIAVARHAPEVGRNLQDHLQARLVFKCHAPTLNDEARSLWGRARMAAEYALFRTGPMSMAASLAVGFLRTRPGLATPDVQFHIQPWSQTSASPPSTCTPSRRRPGRSRTTGPAAPSPSATSARPGPRTREGRTPSEAAEVNGVVASQSRLWPQLSKPDSLLQRGPGRQKPKTPRMRRPIQRSQRRGADGKACLVTKRGWCAPAAGSGRSRPGYPPAPPCPHGSPWLPEPRGCRRS